jgi:hypothetical protein
MNAAVVADAATDDAGKAFATLRAQAALAGHALHCGIDEQGKATYTTSRWAGWLRTFADLDAVAQWLRIVTGHDLDHQARDRREQINAANRTQDQLDEAADFLRGPDGEL